MWQRFTEQARKVVIAAQEECVGDGSAEVQTYHLLLGLTREAGCKAVEILEKFGLSPRRVRDELAKYVPPPTPRPCEASQSLQDRQFSDQAKKVLQQAYNEARQLSHPYVGTEHVLLGLLGDSDDVTARVLRGLDVDVDEVRRRVAELGATEESVEHTPAVKRDPPQTQWTSVEIESLSQEAARWGKRVADVLRTLRIEVEDLRRRVEVLENKAQQD